MGTPFLGEIRTFSFGFAPKGWALCNGQVMAINQNQALFSLLGTMYGGNGTTTFALPDLRSRVAIHAGNGFTQGQAGGEQTHTLVNQEMPSHTHLLAPQTAIAGAHSPAGNEVLAQGSGQDQSRQTVPYQIYVADANPSQSLAPATVGTTAGGQPHPNLMPYLTLNYCIALQGIFPSRN